MAQDHAGVRGMLTSLFISECSLHVFAEGWLTDSRVDSLRVQDDSEIDWKTLPDSNWNLWSAHTLQRRWLTMKRGVRGHEDMTHTGCALLVHTRWAR